MKKIWIASAVVIAAMMTGCGGSSNESDDSQTAIDLPNGKTVIFFDNVSSAQYQYNTDTEEYENMNISGENYDMIGKNGNLVVWNHETVTGIDPKIVMLHDDFDINEGNLTYEYFHYLGHFHEENNEVYFAAHSADEFNPDVSSDDQKSTLNSLNMHLIEQEEIREEIEEVLPSGETLCNFFVLGHEDHEEENIEVVEKAQHVALSTSGKVYIFEDGETGLESSQSVFSLDGVTECKEDESSIIQNDDYGVLIFIAQTQKLYLADSHGEDFHIHSTWDADKFLPSGFKPTQLAGIGEDDDHDDDHDH